MQVKASEIIRPMMLTNGNRCVICHNHPSGDTNPSEEDIRFTRNIVNAFKIVGLDLVDHIIYSDKEFYSFKEEGLL